MTTADAIANTARIDRGDKAAEIDEGLNHGRPAVQDAMAKQGIMTGIAVGGCCELSTSAHRTLPIALRKVYPGYWPGIRV